MPLKTEVGYLRPFKTEEGRLRAVIEKHYPARLPEFELAISTGLRKGSMYGLTWQMIDWNGRMVNLPTSKNGQALHLPLSDSAVRVLWDVYQRGEKTGRVFQSKKTGEPLSQLAALVCEGCRGSRDCGFSLARSETFLCDQVADEGREARGH